MAATTPHVLTPSASSTTNKPLAPMPGTTFLPTISMNKEWVLPPKPKPGRKPAVDTPPTKRKAQNREAQRAFRERRAAKVSELEDQMKAKEEEDQKEQEKLVARVKHLEHILDDCTEKLVYWRGKYSEMEDAYGRERQLRQNAEMENVMLRKGTTNGNETVALSPRRPVQNGYIAEPASGILSGSNTATELSEMGCGKCSVETRCECIEEAFKMENVASEPDVPTFKRPRSPPFHTDNKRRRPSNPDPSSEIDFTAQFATRRPSTLTSSASTSSSVAATAMPDPCGFCSDGTPCVCAVFAKEPPDRSIKPPASTLPTPPESAITTSDPCMNDPGSCTQCRSNPTSTLFCKSLAATTALNPYPSTAKQASSKDTTINCADAYKVLSRHPGFDRATSELNTWLPQLSTVPSATTAFDIEAASVMGVLKLFDRRFGNTGKRTPTTPNEALSDQYDRFPSQPSQSGEGGDAPHETTQIKNVKIRDENGKHDAKDGIWIAYAPQGKREIWEADK